MCSGCDYSESKKSIPVQVLDFCDLVIRIKESNRNRPSLFSDGTSVSIFLCTRKLGPEEVSVSLIAVQGVSSSEAVLDLEVTTRGFVYTSYNYSFAFILFF